MRAWTNLTYTLALSTGFLSSPLVTMIVKWTTFAAGSGFPLESEFLSRAPAARGKNNATEVRMTKIFFMRFEAFIK
jgi:hypothetical protein